MVIALSVVFVGVVGLRVGRPKDLRSFAAPVFGFGLIHGLGLSTRLQGLGLPDDGVVVRVVLFNVGVELGQLVALAILVGVAGLLAARLRRRPSAARAAFGTLVVAGLVVAAIVSLPSSENRDADSEQVAAQDGSTSTCTETDAQAPISPAGGHPAKAFYGPDEQAPEQDLGHVVGDGYVIVRYRPDLPAEQIAQLETWTTADGGSYTIAAPATEQDEPLRAVTALKTASCERFDLDGLAGFRKRWIEFVQSQRLMG